MTENGTSVDGTVLDTSDPQAALRKYLELSFEMLNRSPREAPVGFVYRNSYDFLLQHGKFFAPRPMPAGMWKGPPRVCYGNAIILGTIQGFRYVEGYAVPKFDTGNFFPVEHAWNTDAEGRVALDPTWDEPGIAYFGVEFSVERADDATWNGDSCVLNDYKRNHPLMRQKWTGEDWSKQWPRSRRLELIRRNHKRKHWHSYDPNRVAPEDLTAKELAQKAREMLSAFDFENDDKDVAFLDCEVEGATDADLAQVRRYLSPEENARFKLRLAK